MADDRTRDSDEDRGPNDPSPAEIRRQTAAIRETWTAPVRPNRRVQAIRRAAVSVVPREDLETK